MSFLVIDLENNSIVARYNDRQDAERVCDAFNVVEEINRRLTNTISTFRHRYIIINTGNSSPNNDMIPATIVLSTTAGSSSINNWHNFIGGNAPLSHLH